MKLRNLLKSHDADGSRRWLAPVSLFLAIAVLTIMDVANDLNAGVDGKDLAWDGLIVLLSGIGIATFWRRFLDLRSQAFGLRRDLAAAQRGAEEWRAQARDLLRGLGEAIDQQFGRWSLSPAERQVALLLLKGLSLKEIASLRSTSERTVRQQAFAVYQKAGLAGRAELSAFFLEEMLLPLPLPEAGGGAPRRRELEVQGPSKSLGVG